MNDQNFQFEEMLEMSSQEMSEVQGGASFVPQLIFNTPDVSRSGWGSSMYQYAYNDPIV